MNSNATIDFSAQFGGRDAAAAVLPHFKTLKAAAKGIVLSSFPYPQLAFILRVDGEVNQYGFSGLGDPNVDKNGKYLSIDIGITKEDLHDVPSRISSAILDSFPFIETVLGHRGIGDFNVDALMPSLRLLCERYMENSGNHPD